MKKILFVCDLDNTLLYSAKRKKAGDVCVEMIHEKEQGFMSPRTIELLRDVLKKTLFVPVTTRSIEQYLRIKWPEGCQPDYAITTNGAILLKNESVINEWQNDSYKLVSPYKNELERLKQMLIDEDLYLRCRIVDDMYLFSYCKDGVDINQCQRKYQEITQLNVVASGKKLYLFPPMFNKGEAIKRFEQIENFDIVLSAGDSVIDLPMLAKANIAFVPDLSLVSSNEQKNYAINAYACPENELFSEFVLDSALKQIEAQG